MESLKRFNDAKEAKEIGEIIEIYFKLQAQINNPTREGMIEALSEARRIAPQEISMREYNQGETCFTPWSNIPDEYLYSKLGQSQQGLYFHSVKKFGEIKVKNSLEKYAKAIQK